MNADSSNISVFSSDINSSNKRYSPGKGVTSLSATQAQVALTCGTGCESPWKCDCVSNTNDRMWAFPQIDL